MHMMSTVKLTTAEVDFQFPTARQEKTAKVYVHSGMVYVMLVNLQIEGVTEDNRQCTQ